MILLGEKYNTRRLIGDSAINRRNFFVILQNRFRYLSIREGQVI